MADVIRKKLEAPRYERSSDFQYTREMVISRGSLDGAKEAVSNKRPLDLGKETLPATKKIAVQIEGKCKAFSRVLFPPHSLLA